MRSLAAISCLTLLAVGAADPRGVVIEVDAGAHERRDTILEFPLPRALEPAQALTLESLDDHREVDVQSTTSADPKVVWRLERPLPVGAKRRYRLSPSKVPDSGANAGLRAQNDGQVLGILVSPQGALEYHAAVAEPPAGIAKIFRRSGFIHPLSTRSGVVVTDDFPPDHPHQHGLFLAWVNTTFDGRQVDFWNQGAKTGRIENEESKVPTVCTAGPVFGEIRIGLNHLDLRAPGGPETVLRERWVVRVYNIPGRVLVDFESSQECAGDKPLTVNQSHYGGLGLRGNRQWFDPTVKGDAPPDPTRSGRSDFLTSEGKHRADGNHTRPRWVDLSGAVDGRVGGVTVLDHPGNFRFPQPVRLHPNKPYFCFAPMVLGEFDITPGRPYLSHYRLDVHDGPPDPATIERLWNDYADPPRLRFLADHP